MMIKIPITYPAYQRSQAVALTWDRQLTFLGLTKWKSWLIFGLAAFLATYVWVTNDISTKSTELSYLKQRAIVLTEEQKVLQIKVSALSSLTNLDLQIKPLGLVPINNSTYLKATPVNFARK